MAGAVAALVLFTSFSWVANFNFFYANFMSGDLAAERYQLALDTFDDNMKKAETAIAKEATPSADLRRAVETEMRLLGNEIKDQVKPGIGPRAKEHIANVRELLKKLGTDATEPAHGNKAKKDDEAFIAEFEKRVRAALGSLDAQTPWAQAQQSVAGAIAAKRKLQSGIEQSASPERKVAAVRELGDLTRGVERGVRQAFEIQNRP